MSSQNDTDDSKQAAKRRKIRKGTQSCWECKKRKVRCIWASPNNPACDNCLRRRTRCVGQEYPDEPKMTGNGVESRLSRVEDLLERLVNSAPALSRDTTETAKQKDAMQITDLFPSPAATWTTDSAPLPPDSSLVHAYTGLSRDLVAAWPAQPYLDRIFKLRIGLATHRHMEFDLSPRTSRSRGPATVPEMLQLPPPGAHPVLVARKLLFLGGLLQGALSAGEIEETMQCDYREIMSRAVDTAVRLATSNDELTASVEGIECIMIEAMIHNYGGELHRAWLTTRRASAVAQMLGLHRATSRLPSCEGFDSSTARSVDRDEVCFHIVSMDRYLSIALGLPPSALEGRALAPATLARCHPLDRMGRMQCIISGRILTRKIESHDGKSTGSVEEIDGLLQEAADIMPPQWWLIPSYNAGHSTEPDAVHEVVRAMHQLSHYHLVIRLHLPYILRSSSEGGCSRSRAAAVHASRETLSRHIAFRTWNSGLYYCRGVDFLSFIALTVLCIAHIDARNQPTAWLGAVLDHSRPSDRAMMERTVEILDGMDDDAIATKLSPIMRHLLDVEATSASGVGYSASTSEDDEGHETEHTGQFIGGEENLLQLHIPYFGTINLQRRMVPNTEVSCSYADEQMVSSLAKWDNQWSFLDSSGSYEPLDDLTLQTINEGLFGGLFGGLDAQGVDLEAELAEVDQQPEG